MGKADAQKRHIVQTVRRLLQHEVIPLSEFREGLGVKSTTHTRAWRQAFHDALPGYKEEKRGRQCLLSIPGGAVPDPEAAALAVGLRFAVEVLQPLAGSPWHDALVDHLRQAELRVQNLQSQLDDLQQGFAVIPAGRPKRDLGAIVRTLAKSWRKRRPVDLRYRKANGEETLRTVDPWGLALRGDHALLIAVKHGEGDPQRRHYRIDRILEAQEKRGRFDRPSPARFTASEALKETWGAWMIEDGPVEVRVAVAPRLRVMFEEFHLHASQRLGPTHHVDGEAWQEVQWTVRVCPEVEGFLLSLMPHVRILSPDDLRDNVIRRARDGLERLLNQDTDP